MIGLEASGRDYDGSFKDDNGNVVYRYVAVQDAATCVEAPGKSTQMPQRDFTAITENFIGMHHMINI